VQKIGQTTRYRLADPDITHMTPSQLDDEILLVEDVIQANERWGGLLRDMHNKAPDFDTISDEEWDAAGPATTDTDKAMLAPAQALTDARTAKARVDYDRAIADQDVYERKISDK
jgi:hypothetical protein